MKRKLISLIPYIIALVINFYVFPLLIRDTGSGIFMLLFVMPLITFVCSVVCGILQGFKVLLPVIVATLFTPTLFIFYNESAWVYIVAYAMVALVGNGIGRIFYRGSRNNNTKER